MLTGRSSRTEGLVLAAVVDWATGFLGIVRARALVFARLWRGIAFSTSVAPALFLGAIGVGLGGLVKAHTRVRSTA